MDTRRVVWTRPSHVLNTPLPLLMGLCTSVSRGSDIGRERTRLAPGPDAGQTWRVHRNLSRPRAVLTVALLGAVITLTACSDSSLTGPTVSAEPTEVAEAKNFCGAMAIATESAASARAALTRLYDEMATDDIASKNLAVFNTAGSDVVTYGTAYVTALAQVRDFAESDLYGDVDAISTYWESYAIPVGQMASEAALYVDFVDNARSLIESTETAEMRTAQIRATDAMNLAYSAQCSS